MPGMKQPRFGLHTLLIVIALIALALPVSRTLYWIYRRHEFANQHMCMTWPDTKGELPWYLRLFGEHVYVFTDPDTKYNDEIATYFPEARFENGTYMSVREMMDRRKAGAR
jgi:hypothetical protein